MTDLLGFPTSSSGHVFAQHRRSLVHCCGTWWLRGRVLRTREQRMNGVDNNLHHRPDWKARLPVVAFVTLLALTIGAGLVIRLGALKPTNIFSPETINAAFTVHGFGALPISVGLLLCFTSQIERQNRPRKRTLIGACIIALYLLAVTALVVADVKDTQVFDDAHAFACAFIGGYAASVAIRENTTVSWGVAVTGAAYSLNGVGVLGGLMSGTWWSLQILMAGSLATIAQEESGQLSPLARLALVGFGLLSAASSFSTSELVRALTFFVAPIMPIILVGTTWAAIRAGKPQHVWARRYYVLTMIVFAPTALLRMLLNMVSPSLHLHDTLFSVATFHLESFTPALALLGLTYRDLDNKLHRRGQARLAWAGFALLALGAHIMVWSLLVLGTRGMPRRYVKYLDQFQHLNILGTIGAILLVVGIAIALAIPLSYRNGNRKAQAV